MLENIKRPPLALIILDGWGLAPPGPYNAITQANTPNFDNLWENYSHTKLSAHGSEVGLPAGQVGNSEAGHLNLGAGRKVIQDSVYISEAIADGTFYKNPAFLEAVRHVKLYNSQLHLMGILSGDQCPHMSPDHVIALSKFIDSHKIDAIWHFFTDGRDSLPHAALPEWQKLKAAMVPELKRVGMVAGRLYLDRKKDWARTEQIYNALVLGDASHTARDLEEAIKQAYERGETDEFIAPTLIRNNFVTARDNIADNDVIIFYNLRSDRARQLTKPFVQGDFEELNQGGFARRKILRNIRFIAMTDFGPDVDIVLTAFPARDLPQTLPAVLGSHYHQLYIAEMEKYAHITYFFNGGYPEPLAGEHRILVQSPKVDSYDTTPKMSSPEITGVIVESLQHQLYDFVCVNLCNADMLGHTGNVAAARLGCEIADQCLGQILEAVKSMGGEAVIVADHGNAEIMGAVTASGQEIINTTHETSPVPFVVFTTKKIKLKNQTSDEPGGRLADVAPTMLDLVGIEKPPVMTGESLIV
ncbi:MAG: phosphoglycerate mutase (2,3-diphosphoglycerate-independent) [Candidatus Jacksonbacteria bacterium RIFOXYC2_FULL_44_29]|nr:MAG: 2,3-bisphosphoglycerate-independent phosphoglycerate mutase [Parcubacteria group bacterium GW2011_GWA2_42_28]KKT55141.1 MAG: 2,3-bisphosphoglycerate-independent phosphoglycerate mutase [Parcubacteria group bacterium GW2011_GWC2_44_22]OGY75519.1 MAG: phosphoglycerate mutase (2,3-diphosphoglycerate-independent) [Candidatus Jacksonbacteria bacterium RIFOXYA2_FULL_43_12]OGY75819.1 MAG: phosphoglycerate mutase (2,3-diphosphoglycerate-independent) [Candidatus Jacksonbacteria bacterium RIFOXYB2